MALALFGLRTSELVMLLRKARREERTDHINERIGEFFLGVLGQRGVLRDPLPGIAHFVTFWGFIVIQLGLLDLLLNAFNSSLPWFGESRVFAIILDVFMLLVLLALALFAIRRAVFRPKQLESFLHSPWDGYIILGLIFLVILTLAFVEGFEYTASGGEAWSPLGAFLGAWFSGMGTDGHIIAYRISWWVHMCVVLAFLIYLPRSKHLHLLATPFNIFFRSYQPKGALPLLEQIEEREDYGVSRVEQFTWKQLLDGYACTECGRCNTVCPATSTGKPLYPKEIILGVKEAMFHARPLVGEIITQDALWSCTTCMACVEICPVSIEHVPKIVDMRRSLVMEESDFPKEVTSLFNNIERHGNPWEMSSDKRAEWAANLSIPLLVEHPEADVLYWVGCMGSFDQRNKRVASSLAKILQAAKINFAILGPEESCTGDPARRIGNEYLWQIQAQQNIETLNAYGFNKHRTIITACPHCFNTIKNEYPQLGGDYDVVHHTVFIEKLLSEGKLALPEGFDKRKLTYHDPCYMGRYNDVYNEPRRVLTIINSNGVTEMQHTRNRSFCCGGGGGRAWMEERIGKRINQTRVSEALETNAEVLAAACPFCISMFEDGVKGVEAEEKLKIEDIAEIIAGAIEKK
jgi:Fe-S oxidoreductase